ncbi:MAG: mechanosensitive ion channel family protein [Deltaproteobacteria bacterium]|nr:mechanosensitive ion channel family protein [Deltaproteobacteria bacterium]
MQLWKFIHYLESNPYLTALAIGIASLLAAVLVNALITKVLMRLTSKTRTDLDDRIISTLHKPLFISVVLAGTAYAIRRLNPSKELLMVADTVLLTSIVLLWSAAGIRIGKLILQILSQKAGENRFVQPRTLPLFEIALKILIVGLAIYGVLLVWRVDISAWLASAGILGIAVGFAAKDTLANLFSGVFILADGPYKIGDYIVLESGERGMVTDIGIRSSRILTRDDVQIIIPNAVMANTKIINESGGRHIKERIRANVGVAYGSDIDKVRVVLLDVAKHSEYLSNDPEPIVRFREFGDSSLNFQLLGWISEPALRGRALDELNSAIYKRFAEERIEIPFPQRDVHIKSGPDRGSIYLNGAKTPSA